MLLALDVGNTETVVGLYQDPTEAIEKSPRVGYAVGDERSHGFIYRWRLSTDVARTPDEHAVNLTQLLALEGLDIVQTVSGIVMSSSAPQVTGDLRAMAARWFAEIPLVVLGPGIKSGMPILYDNPKEVGADRIADAVGAYDLFGGPTIVVDLGTATTFDAINAKGEYLGGAIVPGVAISMEALFAQAAALRSVELREPRNVIGRSTVESIQSGVLYGYAAQVDGMCERIERELGDAKVVATGGLSSLIAPHTSRVQHVEPWLTLHGLRLIYDRTAANASR